jgi:hypothetical protein
MRQRATPIFVDAIKNMTSTDAKTIIKEEYHLQNSTHQQFYTVKFNPVIKNSFNKAGADQLGPILRNSILKTNPMNDYKAINQAMAGVFKMIAC